MKSLIYPVIRPATAHVAPDVRGGVDSARFRIVLAISAVFILSACETPTEVTPDVANVNNTSAFSVMNAYVDRDIVIVEPDGSPRPVFEDEEGITLGIQSKQGVDVVITGSARYGTGNVSRLRFNVRQTVDGDVTGSGVATIFSQEVGLTPECIKPITSFGRTYYGVNVAFSEPLVMTTPWGTASYTHGALSVADGGDLANLVLANTSGCFAAALLYPYEPESGRIEVVPPAK